MCSCPQKDGDVNKWDENGCLPAHVSWLGYQLQLWVGLRYGIGTLTNKLERTRTVLTNLDYYDLLPVLGVARTVKRE